MIYFREMSIEMYGYVACGVGAAAFITGLLPKTQMERVQALLHNWFGKGQAKRDTRVSSRTQLLIFGAFFLFLGLLVLGVVRL